MGDEQWFELDKRLEVIDKGSCSCIPPDTAAFRSRRTSCSLVRTSFLDFANRGYRAVAPNLRGHGGSPIAKPLNRCSIADYVDDVCSVVEDLPTTAWTRLVRGDLTGAPVALEDHAFRGAWPRWISRRRRTGGRPRWPAAMVWRCGAGGPEFGSGDRRCDRFGVVGVRRDRGAGRDGQRMESVAPADGVMLSESTARLVDGAAALGEPEMVSIKDANEPARAWSPVRRMA